ncbi:MAG: hypothetical protein AB7V46_13765 [Thermomicrobiales bacterium]
MREVGSAALPRRMQLRYGFNEIDAWWHVSLGPHSEEIRRQMRRMSTSVVRLFVFDKPVPDPVTEWRLFVAYVDAILDVGAVPMITFAKFHQPIDAPRNLDTFIARCCDVVWGCLEQWGGDRVRDWLWCIWNEPNNKPVGEGLTYEQYAQIYLRTSSAIIGLLEPHLDGRRAMIGGPALDGFQPYWQDWIVRLLSDVDERLIGFVSWHHYGDWRPVLPGAELDVDLLNSPDAPEGGAYERLLMAQTPEYEARARAVARILGDRNILNVCGELNSIVHHDHTYVGGLNQNAFGAAYYASALIHLIRGGADLEMRWVATENDDAYGLICRNGEVTPAGLAKQLFAEHVRFGDWISFPSYRPDMPDVDSVVAWTDDGRISGVFVHAAKGELMFDPSDWDDRLGRCTTQLCIDERTGNTVRSEVLSGRIRFDDYGVIVVTNMVV